MTDSHHSKLKLSAGLQQFEPEISPQRQAQFVLAILSLVGIILGNSVSQWFYLLNVGVGVDLLVASLTGSCGLTKLCQVLPWNQPLQR